MDNNRVNTATTYHLLATLVSKYQLYRSKPQWRQKQQDELEKL